MKRKVVTFALSAMLVLGLAASQGDSIKSAMSAGPASLSGNAAIQGWDGALLRPGSNGWTCLPDRADTEGNDPWCVNGPWLNFIDALVNKKEPTYEGLGVAYMLMGDASVSNQDPYATDPTGPEDWVTDVGPHLMLLVPDRSLLKAFSTDHLNGGPWVMWPDTPYAHLMVPLESRGK